MSRTPGVAIHEVPGTNLLLPPILLPPAAQSRVTPRLTIHQIRVIQWNNDSLATKFHELAGDLERYRINVALIHETKLCQEDPTTQIPGFNAVRWDREESDTRHLRGGGLMAYIRQGIQYSVPFCATTNPMELRKVITGRQISTTNVNLPPHRSDYSSSHQNDQSWLYHRLRGLHCSSQLLQLLSLRTLRARRFTTGWKHSEGSAKRWFSNDSREITLIARTCCSNHTCPVTIL